MIFYTGCAVGACPLNRRGPDSNKAPATAAPASGHAAASSQEQAHVSCHRAEAAAQTATMYRDGPAFVAKPYTLKVEAASRGRTSTVARCTVDLARLCACSPAGSRTDLRLRLKCAPARARRWAGSVHPCVVTSCACVRMHLRACIRALRGGPGPAVLLWLCWRAHAAAL